VPVRRAFNAVFENAGAALGAKEDVVHVPRTAGYLTAVRVNVYAAGILVGDGMVVVDVPCLGSRHCRPPIPHARRGGCRAFPRRLVEAMDVLFGVEIAGKPDEVLPVAQLILHLGPFRLPRIISERRGQVSLLDALDFADGPIENALHRLLHAVIVAPA